MNRLEEIQKRVKDYEAALHCGAGDIESALPQARMAIERYVYTDLKHLLAENTQLRSERDAAIEDLRRTPGITPCYCCKYRGHEMNEEKCHFDTRVCFKWRGLEADHE